MWALQSQPERAGSFQHLFPSVDLRCYQTKVLQERWAPDGSGRSVKGLDWKLLIFWFGKNWLLPCGSCAGPGPEKGPALGSLLSSGSRWLSPKLEQTGGAHFGLPLERLSRPQHVALHLTSLVVSPAPSPPATLSPGSAASAAASLSRGGFQPASRCAHLCEQGPRAPPPSPGPAPRRPLPLVVWGAR